jgi:uncharacterized protein (TIGR00369 family)
MDDVSRLAEINRQFFTLIPLNKAMELRLGKLGRGTAEMTLPYLEKFVGDPVSGVMHGGAVTTLMDSACGAAVFMALDKPDAIATLDLRIDYLRAAQPGRDVIASAECFHLGKNVAFVRAVAHHGDRDMPIASAAGCFMIGTHVPGLAPP